MSDNDVEGTLMDDTSGDDIYQPGEIASRLFFTDADAEKTDPESAIAAVLQGDWEHLEPEVAALLADESTGVYDRFLALSTLARWASQPVTRLSARRPPTPMRSRLLHAKSQCKLKC